MLRPDPIRCSCRLPDEVAPERRSSFAYGLTATHPLARQDDRWPAPSRLRDRGLRQPFGWRCDARQQGRLLLCRFHVKAAGIQAGTGSRVFWHPPYTGSASDPVINEPCGSVTGFFRGVLRLGVAQPEFQCPLSPLAGQATNISVIPPT